MESYIERDKAIELLTDMMNDPWNDRLQNFGIYRAIKAVTEMPSADVVPVRNGAWVKEIFDGEERPACSLCHCPAVRQHGHDLLTSYCPDCGAYLEVI